jgi:hypothetical protein
VTRSKTSKRGGAKSVRTGKGRGKGAKPKSARRTRTERDCTFAFGSRSEPSVSAALSPLRTRSGCRRECRSLKTFIGNLEELSAGLAMNCI